MHRCYLPGMNPAASHFCVEGEEARHALKVMRLRVGECCELFDGCGHALRARITATAGASSMQLEAEELLPPLPPVAGITLALAIPKGTNMDLIVQKAVEMGVSRIIPLISERTIVRLDATQAEARAAKWQRTVLEACKQCGVNTLPVVETPQRYARFLMRDDLPPLRLQCALVPDAQPLRTVLEAGRTAGATNAALLIGPEGDFSPAEYKNGREAGFAPVSLGPIILRVETAVFMAVAAARYALDVSTPPLSPGNHSPEKTLAPEREQHT